MNTLWVLVLLFGVVVVLSVTSRLAIRRLSGLGRGPKESWGESLIASVTFADSGSANGHHGGHHGHQNSFGGHSSLDGGGFGGGGDGGGGGGC